MITVSSSAFAQEQSGVQPAASRAAVDSAKIDSAGIAKSAVKKQAHNGGTPDNSYKGFCPHEVSFWLGGGWSSLNTYPTYGDRDYRFGGALGLGYSYHFNEHWSILLGAELALYNMKMSVDDLKDRITTVDPDGRPIVYNAEVEHYVEKDRLYALNIPLQVQFQTPLNEEGHEFYAALGAKFGFPFSMKYKVKDANFITYGDYLDYGQWLYDQSDLGYGNNSGKIKQQPLKTNVLNIIGTAEAGIKWNINNPRLNLYTGLYFDWGFTDLRKNDDTRFLEYDRNYPDRFQLNSVLTSEYSRDGGKIEQFSDKLSTVSLGLKVRLGINTCAASRVKRPESKDSRDKDNSKDDIDPYRKGYRDAYNDLGDKEPRRSTVSNSNDNAVPERKNAKPIDYTPAPERNNYYQGDPLLEAEMKRAQAEYGKLKDLLVMYVDGYEVNQSKLSPIMEKMIDDKIRLLQKYNSDKYIIICEGHTCDLGREEFNLNLAQKRAEVVREYLISKGFNGDNLVAASKGETTPIVANDGEANRKINRRVVFLIKEKH
ncbi:hypothetical protein FACS189434_10590 [Bacteroidia bacterium]|nr:hypothetical protein FACS189434_10590 [Bacteroidia bacterium]